VEEEKTEIILYILWWEVLGVSGATAEMTGPFASLDIVRTGCTSRLGPASFYWRRLLASLLQAEHFLGGLHFWLQTLPAAGGWREPSATCVWLPVFYSPWRNY